MSDQQLRSLLLILEYFAFFKRAKKKDMPYWPLTSNPVEWYREGKECKVSRTRT